MINIASRAESWKEAHPRAKIENLVSLHWLSQEGFSKRCCPRIMGNDLRSSVFLAGTEKIGAIFGRLMISDRPGNVLFNAFLQLLGCTSDVPNIAVADKLINNIIVVWRYSTVQLNS